MGHMVETIAHERGHETVLVIDRPEEWNDETMEKLRHADVAIEFSIPSAAEGNIIRCFEAGVPVVSGTTGWQNALADMKKRCDDGQGTLLHSSNFSIGVNIFRAVNRRLAKLMDPYPQYSPRMEETHHIHKLDHPSGTAITLAEELIGCSSRIERWKEEAPEEAPQGDLPVNCLREGEVPGIHSVTWDSPEDLITITHSAKSRRGFALGAVIAAEWLASQNGFKTMGDMLGF